MSALAEELEVVRAAAALAPPDAPLDASVPGGSSSGVKARLEKLQRLDREQLERLHLSTAAALCQVLREHRQRCDQVDDLQALLAKNKMQEARCTLEPTGITNTAWQLLPAIDTKELKEVVNRQMGLIHDQVSSVVEPVNDNLSSYSRLLSHREPHASGHKLGRSERDFAKKSETALEITTPGGTPAPTSAAPTSLPSMPHNNVTNNGGQQEQGVLQGEGAALQRMLGAFSWTAADAAPTVTPTSLTQDHGRCREPQAPRTAGHASDHESEVLELSKEGVEPPPTNAGVDATQKQVREVMRYCEHSVSLMCFLK